MLTPRQPRAARPAGFRWRAAALAAGLTGLVRRANGWYQTAEQARHPLRPPGQGGRRPAHGAGPRLAATPPEQPRVAELQNQLERMQKTVEELQTAEAEHRRRSSAQLAEKPPVAPARRSTPGSGTSGSSGDVVRGGSGDAVTEVPAGATLATLLLRAGEAQGERDIEITDAQGRVAWTARGLRLDPVGQDYSLTLHRGDLARGDYTIRLFRTENGQRTPAESYAIRVEVGSLTAPLRVELPGDAAPWIGGWRGPGGRRDPEVRGLPALVDAEHDLAGLSAPAVPGRVRAFSRRRTTQSFCRVREAFSPAPTGVTGRSRTPPPRGPGPPAPPAAPASRPPCTRRWPSGVGGSTARLTRPAGSAASASAIRSVTSPSALPTHSARPSTTTCGV